MDGFNALDRVVLILFAVIFYLLVRLLQQVQDDIREIKTDIDVKFNALERVYHESAN